MSEPVFGKLIQTSMTKLPPRDAIHVATIPLIAAEALRPGSKVRLKRNTKDIAISATYNKDEAVGVVDPFLDVLTVHKGDIFWCFLYPKTISGLRHHWEHPVFDAPEPNINELNEHEEWIRNFAEEWGFNYDDLIRETTSNDEWRYATCFGSDLHSGDELGSDHDLFWYHLEKLTGKTFDEKHRRETGWSCSC